MPRLCTSVAMGLMIISLLNTAQGAEPAENASAKARPLTFEADVRPILKAHCFLCHGEDEELQGNLDLRLVRSMAKGGDSGPAIEPGKPAESLVIERIEAGEMPPSKKKLPAGDLTVLRRWIEQGAKTARAEPASAEQAEFTDEERSFWSFQPVSNPQVPTVKHSGHVTTPIDAFLLARLERENLTFSPQADKLTLVRRAYFDLLGLPPAPEAVDEFLTDQRPDAWERLIDRLLASPHYGERWARHWLDVAGYSDSDGYSEKDIERPYAYKYRDYVIRAMNEDRPFDQFIQEQLAGDELLRQPFENLSDADGEKLIATGFLRMGPDGTGDSQANQNAARNEAVAEAVKIMTTSLLGLSVGCAQCHNHRYDPISQTDYYRIRALLEPAYDWKAWRNPQQRLVSLWSEDEKKLAAEIQAEVEAATQQRNAEIQRQIAAALEVQIANLPAEVRDRVGDEAREALLNTPKNKRTDKQKQLFQKYPALNLTEGELRRFDNERFQRELDAYQKKVAEIKARGPKENLVQALTEVPGHVPSTYLFSRGDFNNPTKEVAPGELAVLTDGKFSVRAQDADLPTSGRRLAYARHLTDGKHPLTSRVLVNRFWMHHFGQGIVATPADFGAQGSRPTHPELLDWLASEFVRGGWRLKSLHKLIVLSTAYRQTSLRTPSLETLDPDNHLLGRMNVRRLDAETIRDSVLTVSGKLNAKMYGPALPVAPDGVGQVVIGTKAGSRDGRVNALKGNDPYRRSIYVQARRSLPLAMLQTFDSPTMAPNCELRSNSTVTPQSLLLMNNTFVIEQSEVFAQRVMNEAGTDPEAQILRAWRLALDREPSQHQSARARQFIESQRQFFEKQLKDRPSSDKRTRFAADPAAQALANFCQFLFSNNAFLYVD